MTGLYTYNIYIYICVYNPVYIHIYIYEQCLKKVDGRKVLDQMGQIPIIPLKIHGPPNGL